MRKAYRKGQRSDGLLPLSAGKLSQWGTNNARYYTGMLQHAIRSSVCDNRLAPGCTARHGRVLRSETRELDPVTISWRSLQNNFSETVVVDSIN